MKLLEGKLTLNEDVQETDVSIEAAEDKPFIIYTKDQYERRYGDNSDVSFDEFVNVILKSIYGKLKFEKLDGNSYKIVGPDASYEEKLKTIEKIICPQVEESLTEAKKEEDKKEDKEDKKEDEENIEIDDTDLEVETELPEVDVEDTLSLDDLDIDKDNIDVDIDLDIPAEDVPEDIVTSAKAMSISDVVRNEFDSIDAIKGVIATLTLTNDDINEEDEKVIDILNEIINLKLETVGMLNKALEITDGDLVASMEDGADKAEEIIADDEIKVDDIEDDIEDIFGAGQDLEVSDNFDVERDDKEKGLFDLDDVDALPDEELDIDDVVIKDKKNK